MPGNSRQLAAEAEREYPVRVRVAAGAGFGQALIKMHAWLDENCGADSWKTAPSGMRGVENDATAFYFRNATIAAAERMNPGRRSPEPVFSNRTTPSSPGGRYVVF